MARQLSYPPISSADSRRRGGFTLMEILIAIAVIVIGLVGVVSVFPVALRDVQTNQDRAIAAQIAQSVKAALRVGFANAQYNDGLGRFVVPFVHPGTRPDDLPPPSVPGIDVEDEAIDYLVLPPAGDLDRRPTVYPDGREGGDPLKFYRLSYDRGASDDEMLRAYGQAAEDTQGSNSENGFQTLRDPYVQYGFSLTITAMEDREDLFMVGIWVCRNPDLYTQIGSGEFDEFGVLKDQFYTILALR